MTGPVGLALGLAAILAAASPTYASDAIAAHVPAHPSSARVPVDLDTIVVSGEATGAPAPPAHPGVSVADGRTARSNVVTDGRTARPGGVEDGRTAVSQSVADGRTSAASVTIGKTQAAPTVSDGRTSASAFVSDGSKESGGPTVTDLSR